MSEDLIVDQAQSKSKKYETLLPQIDALVGGETDLIANLGNICAALKETFNFLWVGFYFVKKDELVLGPFQGPIACTRIQKGKGVCGTAWQLGVTQIVDDVDAFPGHIACSSESKSEIVLPIQNLTGDIVAVLDIDSTSLESFDKTDQLYLEKVLELVKTSMY